MEYKTIDGLLLRDMVVAGAELLEKNRELVDALNVFPVPDGDTGTNMSLTMQSATREINSKEFLRADEAANALSKGALRGARGNSGVITSQLFRGFAKALQGNDKITPVQFAQALKAGADLAYKAVMKPKEGTILTVARVVAEDAVKQVEKDPDDYNALMSVIVKSGEAILKKTPDMLPVLKQAGVVDSGGKGLMFIYQGYAAVIRGEENPVEAAESAAGDEDSSEEESYENQQYRYCVDFSVINLRDDISDADIDSFRRRLKRVGDHVSVDGSHDCVKVHVHTDLPGNVMNFALEMGEIADIKVDNMAEIVRREKAAQEPEESEASKEPEKDFGMVAVSLGEGFSEIFRDLTVDFIVEGGQTMNPSIEDILDAINSVNAKCVFVFPNNGNVVMAARQAAEMADKQVFVIPTKNVAMGIAAAVAFQPEATPEDNAQRMEDAAQHVKTGTVTYAVRDSEYNDIPISKGDIIGMHNGAIEYAGHDVHDVVINMMKNIITDEDELITVYYGADTSEADAQALTDEIAGQYDFCDVECHRGGQPLYYYLISVE